MPDIGFSKQDITGAGVTSMPGLTEVIDHSNIEPYSGFTGRENNTSDTTTASSYFENLQSSEPWKLQSLFEEWSKTDEGGWKLSHGYGGSWMLDFIDYVNSLDPSLVSSTDTAVDNALEGGWSMSDYMDDHPGAGYEEIMQEAARHSDEYAEKYVDYLMEKGELDRANQYTASREDTAYQRLVGDLQKAGLNPALMYGSSASPQASGSQGYVRVSEGANSRAISNYDKMKELLLKYMSYELKKKLGTANTVLDGVDSVLDFISSLIPGTSIIKKR